MKFGCVWFDDFGKEGWASEQGKDAYRISGTQDLPSDTLWVTNLDWQGMRDRSLNGHPRFRMDNFLRIKLSSLAIELDIKNDGDVAERTKTLSEIIDRVCRLAISIFNVSQFLDDLPQTLRASILQEKDERSYGSPIVDYAIGDAMQTWQKCETVSPQGSNFYTWRFPRMDYAGYLLSFPIPTSKWKKVDLNRLDVRKYLDENLNTTPFLCKITINKINDPSFGQIMPFGYGVNNRQRMWASGQEVLHYMNYADVEVTQLLESNGFRDLQLTLPNFEDMTGKISISMGILAECCWKSISAKKTPRSVWYTSWDRISLSKTALALTEAGIPVMGYGTGGILLSVHQSQYEYVFNKCIELGLTPPLNMLAHMDAA